MSFYQAVEKLFLHASLAGKAKREGPKFDVF